VKPLTIVVFFDVGEQVVVEDEVTTTFEEERKRGQLMLFPIRLDDSVMTTEEVGPRSFARAISAISGTGRIMISI
jgi:hypothetical protein